MAITKKWFYEPQKEVNKELTERYKDNARLITQVVCKSNVYEKYIIQDDKEMFVLLFEMVKTDYGKGYKILKYRGL